MHSQNMLELDPDVLFEQRSIADIEQIQKKIQDEVERKREELRTMVGERYRDLIMAADTITAMQVTSSGVINKIQAMEDLCSVFQQRHLLGFQIDPTTHTSIHRNDVATISASVQAKILVTIPEYIWRSLEKNDFLRGAQYFLLARHIKTGILLEEAGPLARLRPSLMSQWELISQFQSKLISGSEQALLNFDIAPEFATSCLCVLVLLSGLNAQSLVEQFLSLRKSALENSLSGDSKVKLRIAASLLTLLYTLSLTTVCFKESRSGSSGGLVWQQLQNISSPPSSGSLDPTSGVASTSELLDSLPLDPATLRFIPSVVREFRPSSPATTQPLSPEDVSDLCSKWLSGINVLLQTQVANALKLVTGISGVQSVRESALDDSVANGRSWDSALKRRSEIWATYYQPVVTGHVQSLVETHWKNALAALRERLADSLREALRERGQQPENDLRWFVWKERATDLPQPTQVNKKHQHCGLFLKSRGYSPKIEGLCSILNKALSEMLEQLSSYMADESETERIQLLSHMQEKSAFFVNELWKHVEEDCLNGAVARDEGSIVLVARLLGALTELCPALQKCFSPVTSDQSPTAKMAGRTSVAWTDIVKTLRTGSEKTWEVWQKLVNARLKSVSEEQLFPKVDSLGPILLHSAPQWDEQFVEEQSEAGDRLKSLIRVPAQPSFGLQSVLSQACQILGAAQPHTIPSVVRATLVENLVISILDLYQGATSINNADGSTSKISQPHALQLLLDTKFLSALLIPRTHKALSTKVQQVCQALEQNVDPFDLDVFSPFIQNNVRLSVRRMQCLLGVLVTCWREKYPTMNTATTGPTGTTSAEQPSVLAVCPPAPWFPLLPGVTRSAVPSKPAPAPAPVIDKGKRQTETRHQKQKSEPIEGLKSGAAAFFGAVSSEWFGSS